MCKNCAILLSLPAWECGLKSMCNKACKNRRLVTPCVGVWIEMAQIRDALSSKTVTPCVGVWIEIVYVSACLLSPTVTPCVGVWIEILGGTNKTFNLRSLPAWECGLKFLNT